MGGSTQQQQQQRRLLSAAATAILLAALTATTQVDAQQVPDEIYVIDPDNSDNVTQVRDCVSRPERSECPDRDITFNLYSGGSGEYEEMDVTDPTWLSKSRYDASLPTVMLVHGYRGGDSLLPLVVLKDAYNKRGQHNVIMLDWGPLAVAQCYVQAVRSLKTVAKCTAHMLSFLSSAGVNTQKITCVGHSLGAHICGLIANYVPQRMEKIVGLDPAHPLMQFRRADSRLDDGDAKVVQVIHTNTGFYGASGSIGTADFCVNNGRIQPFCEKANNVQLCSHLHAVCFYAASLDEAHALQASPCSQRCLGRTTIRNPQTIRDRLRNRSLQPVLYQLRTSSLDPIREQLRMFATHRTRRSTSGNEVLMGEHMADSARGMYCVTALEAPFCLNTSRDPEFGDSRCCPKHKI